MSKKILLLGSTGKMGLAIEDFFKNGYSVIGKHSSDFDAFNFAQVSDLVEENSPDIVINTVALVGTDFCEKEPIRALQLNTLLPKFLAELSNKEDFLLIHFSTDAVFNDEKRDCYVESDASAPLNIYGFTKYGGDCFIQAIAKTYYIFRISILFGETAKNTQFVEKMLQKVKEGVGILKISHDVVASPTYSRDVAGEIRRVLEARREFGLYHVVNNGKASLYDLMQGVVKNLNLKVKLEKASCRDFPTLGIKNTYTPLASEKLPPLRPWQEALEEYCLRIKDNYQGK